MTHSKSEQGFAHLSSWIEGERDSGQSAPSSRGVTFVDDHALELTEWWNARPPVATGYVSPEWCAEQRQLIGRRWCELAHHLGLTLDQLHRERDRHPAAVTLQAQLANVRELERAARRTVAQWKLERRAWQRARPKPPSTREQEVTLQRMARVSWRARARARVEAEAVARVEWAERVALAWVRGTSVGRRTVEQGVAVRAQARETRRRARLVTAPG